jgi:hypothetical protein
VDQAFIRLWSVEPLDGGLPRLAVSPEADLQTAPKERDRVDREAGRASLLITEASAEQLRMLAQLAAQSADGKLRFRSVEILQRFLAATASAVDSLSDDQVIAAWQDAGGRSDEWGL